jgi:flagellar hook protein FlgE
MGMLTAMYSGVSGLNVHGRALSSVADNIANLNTYAYKSTRTNFGDIMVHSLTVGGNVVQQVGTGARVLNVQNMMTQGAFESTDIPTDLAINGRGFFQVSDPDSVTGESQGFYYTRAGNFVMDKEGYLVNPSALRLRGYNVDATGELEQIVEDIRIISTQADAIATTTVDLSVNLDAEDYDYHDQSEPIDPTDNDTYNYLTTVRTYDSLGVAHDLAAFFQRLDASTYTGAQPATTGTITGIWKVSMYETADGTFTQANIYDTSSGVLPTPAPTDQYSNTFFLHFDTDGHLVGTSTELDPAVDSFTAAATVTDSTAPYSPTEAYVSDRIGESLTYTPVDSTGTEDTTTTTGQQVYKSTLDITFAGGAHAGDVITIGSTTPITLASVGDAAAADELANAINQLAEDRGYWAVANGDTVTIYGDAVNPFAVTATPASGVSTDITMTGDSMQDLEDAIDNGKDATVAMWIDTTACAGRTIDITVPSGTYTTTAITAVDTLQDVVNRINVAIAAGGGNEQLTATYSGTAVAAVDTDGCILLTAADTDITGTAGNSITISASTEDGDLRFSGSGFDGGMDGTGTGSATGSDILANVTDNGSGGYTLQLARRVPPSSTDYADAAILMASSNTLGDSLSLNFDTWTQDTYANNGHADTGTETDGERDITFGWESLIAGATDYGSTEPQTITFDFTPTSTSNSTQSAGSSETFYLYQDGSPRGTLQSLDIDSDGTITGQFSNGTLRTLGAVVLVNFANPAALERQGENLWVQTLNSGEPVVNRPGQAGLGDVESGALEQSNVDLANEFVKMINYQRAFQANSKTISTTDQMLAELIQLKR